MGLWKWPSVALAGDAHYIPNECPNCMAPAVLPFRQVYRSPWFLLTKTTYSTNINYCARCERTLKAHYKWKSWGWTNFALSLAVLFVTVPVLLLFLGPNQLPTYPVVVRVAIIFGPMVLLWLVLSRFRRRIKTANPLDEGQARFGPSAYYTGDTFGGWGSRRVYRAVRPEWLAALVRLNPGQVDAATYARMTGEAAPAK